MATHADDVGADSFKADAARATLMVLSMVLSGFRNECQFAAQEQTGIGGLGSQRSSREDEGLFG